ncbi:class I SAM-dependent methyltransferase [Nocardia panacis]|uniref:Class I SAM-dependent methyltransferase n=1 Tax=Nocardia panacis TaxID=2340916 RepID=A0A3A4JRD4_9NOCA|nr:class I SAM-dependent methyltransferase [Nocardia panacis]RJO72069.1 class I SAM-dependent methyltransferase [Nocardia panacis]
MANSTEQHEMWTRRAGSFGAHAADYERHRPDYPVAGIRWALESAPPGGTLLDLGAGTGKLTGGLRAMGYRVIAVEPDADMRAELTAKYPDIPVYSGTAESIPLPDAVVDAVAVGQAFHWFDKARAFPEIARILRPAGVLAALWNDSDRTVDWVRDMERLADEGEDPNPAVEDLPAHPFFPSSERRDFAHSQRRTADSLTAQLGTHSALLILPEQERTEMLRRVLTYLRGHPDTGAGEFEAPMLTTVIRAIRH